MTEKYGANLLSPAEAAQPVVESTSRISKIRRLRQRLGRQTSISQVDSPNLPGDEDTSYRVAGDLDHGIAVELDPEVLDDEIETPEVAAYKEELKRPTPKEQALLLGNIVHEEFRGGGQHYVELDNGETGLYWPNTNTNGAKYLSERAAYLVDRAWQFGLVPTTVLRFERTGYYGDKYKLSFQEYIANAIDSSKIKNFEAAEQFYNDFYKLFILNYCIWNTDQHRGNVIATDRLYAIDHQHAFWENSDRWRHSFMDVYILGASAPKDVIAAAVFLNDKIRQRALEEQLKEELHYPDHIIQACLARMIHVAKILTTKGRIDTLEELAEYSPN